VLNSQVKGKNLWLFTVKGYEVWQANWVEKKPSAPFKISPKDRDEAEHIDGTDSTDPRGSMPDRLLYSLPRRLLREMSAHFLRSVFLNPRL